MKLTLYIVILLSNFICYGQIGSTDKFPVYKIKPDTLVKGFIDKNGRQGSFYTYNDNNTINFIRTYKNDTLNGFLGCYSPMGFVNSEQFYKNGERDGIYFEYQGENKIASKGYYKNGLKHGIFLDFFENGNLKYEAFFQNDTLIGDEIDYYPNKFIRFIGNTQSENHYFDDKGRLERTINFENGIITRIRYYCSDSLKNLPKTFIQPHTIQSKDIQNATSLKVEELYSNYQTSRTANFLTEAQVSIVDSLLTIRLGNIIYFVKPNGLYQCNGCADYDSDNNTISISNFGTNSELYKNELNDDEIRYFIRDETIPSNTYKIIVHRQKMQCQDTGNNPLTIEYKGKKLSIANLKNIQVFEYDSDKNGRNEIYIISFQSCDGLFKILKVW